MYTFTAHELGGLTLFEAVGTFSPGDIWALVGEKARVATFTFAAESVSWRAYGRNFYSRDEREDAPGSLDPSVLRLETAMRDVSAENQRSLKYAGVPISEITAIQFTPLERPVEWHASGEKKIPSVIEIPLDLDPWVDTERIAQNYLISKHNSGVELAPYEKAQLVGSILAFNSGSINGQIAEQFGFDRDAVQNNPEVRWHYLSIKQRRKVALTEPEQAWLEHLKERRRHDAIMGVMQEYKRCRIDRLDATAIWPSLERVLRSAIDFRPSVLLHGKRQVYWDLTSYAHIALRHVKGMQVTEGTTLPYLAEDLEMLIEKVLGRVEDEIKDHLQGKPGKAFFLAGRRSVYFNDDFYSFHLDGSGRLANFHCLGPRRSKSA